MAEKEENTNYIVTARKWRPIKFRDVVGQEHISTTLQNAIKVNRIHHAYLFSGPRGVGKTTTARILARALNCQNNKDIEADQLPEPCNECDACLSILQGRSLDVIEIDGASNNSVDDVRKLRENAKYPPSFGKYKMYIIDEVHMLSTSAFNALLKTLEEPPPHLLFVFATTESHKVPATILSRCQRFEFRRIEIETIAKHIKHIAKNENIEIDDDSLVAIAKKADGSMRDSQSIFDQVVAFCGNKIIYSEMAKALHLIDQDFFFRISRAVLQKDIAAMFDIAREVANNGYDFQETLSGLLEHFRNILTVKVTGKTELIETSDSFRSQYLSESNSFSQSDIMRCLTMVSNAEQQIRYAPHPRVKFETVLAQLASIDSSVEISELLNELKSLKKNFKLEENPEYTSKVAVKIPEIKSTPVLNDTDKGKMAPKLEHTEGIDKKNETVSASKDTPIKEEKRKHTPSGDISKENLEKEWQGFCKMFAKTDYGLQSLNQNVVNTNFLNGEIIVETMNEFIAEDLVKVKAKFSSCLEKYFGKKIEIRIVTGISDEDFQIPEYIEEIIEENRENDNKSNKNKASFDRTVRVTDFSNRNEVEKAIIELFDAEEIINN